MQLTPNDIATFAYCPYLYWERGTAQVVPPLSTFEDTVRKSILIAETKALKNGTYVNPRSIGNVWERTWWETASAAGIDFEEAEKTSLGASFKFADYCKYDISSALYATIAVSMPFQIQVKKDVLVGEIDMIKLPVHNIDKEVTLIDFSRKGMTRTQMANDLSVLSTIYAYSELKRDITYMCIDLSEGREKLKIAANSFAKDDIKKVRRTIEYIAEGIRNRVNYKPHWICGECNKCRNSKS